MVHLQIAVMLLRAAKEAGIDVDDPNMKLAQTSTRIGILPTGLYFDFKEEILHVTRMHSSRMRSGRTLTVFQCLVRGGGGVSPKKAEIKKKFPPKKIGGSPLNPPQKTGTP